jgi:hypothetical protein
MMGKIVANWFQMFSLEKVVESLSLSFLVVNQKKRQKLIRK